VKYDAAILAAKLLARYNDMLDILIDALPWVME
jgi:hypothetical protein